MKRIYTSIDIGSDTIKVVVCELYKGKLNLLAAVEAKSLGVKQGLINDVNLAKESISKAIKEAEAILGISITKIIANIPSYFNDFSLINGKIDIDIEVPISGSQVSDVIKDAIKDFRDTSKEILAVLPIDFKVDNVSTDDPKGITGKTLAIRAIMVTTSSKNVYSVVGILESLGIEVIDIASGSIGDINTFTTEKTKEEAGFIINIGSEITTISLFNKGIIIKNSILQIGGKNIDGDIAYVYKLDINDAKKIKEKFALSHKNYASSIEVIEVTNKLNELLKVNQAELSEIVYARIEQMLNLIKKEINGLANRKIDYIIITGGISNLPYFDKVSEAIIGSNVTIGNIDIIGLRNNKYSTSLGNIIYFIQKLKLKGKAYTMISKEEADIISSPKKNTVNETNIFKALVSFFDE